MASVAGLPRLKNNSHKIIACRAVDDFVPVAGTAVSLQGSENAIRPSIIPFNGEFYGIACEFKQDDGLCTVVRSGLAVGVLVDQAVTINPLLATYFQLTTGLLTDENGVPVDAKIKTFPEYILYPIPQEAAGEQGALISFDQATTIAAPAIPPDFNRPDFDAADFA